MPLIYTPILWNSEQLVELLGDNVVRSPDARAFQVTGVRLRADAVEAGDLFVARGKRYFGPAVRAAADRGAVAVMYTDGAKAEIDEHLHQLVVKDLDQAIETMAKARREASKTRVLAVVGGAHQAEAMLIGELLGQEALGYLADGPVEEGLCNLGPQPERAIFHVAAVPYDPEGLPWLDAKGVIVLNPADVDADGWGAWMESLGDDAVVFLPAKGGKELDALVEKVEASKATLKRFGRHPSAHVHLAGERKAEGRTVVEIGGDAEFQVELSTQNPAVDRCVSAIAGVAAGGGDPGRAAFALTVLSVAAASAERMQMRQIANQGSMATPEQLQAAAAPAPGPELDDSHREEIGKLVFDWLAGGKAVPGDALRQALQNADGPVYVSLREDGTRLHETWGQGPDATAGLKAAIESSRNALGNKAKKVDGVELCLSYGYRVENLANQGQRRRVRANVHRGVRGVEFSHNGQTMRAAPTYSVATNRDVPKLIEAFAQQQRLTEAQFNEQVKCRTFAAEQLWIGKPRDAKAALKVRPLFRGNTLVPVESIDRAAVEGLQRDLGDFLAKSVQDDGRMIYMYYPSRGTEDTGRNNMIRQWMATCALGRTGRFREDKRFTELAERNIRYNLRKFYSTSGKLGLIEYSGKVKLGAVALAALSIFEHPSRQKFKRVESKLSAMIEHLWNDDGSFTTFFKPAGRNDVQNFYPGEAQLYRAFVLEEQNDAGKLDEKALSRFMDSFRYYRDWHFENRNPAFIPWHVQAYYKVWKFTRDDELREFIFTTSDWLLGMQQGTEVLYPDCIGRFHDPKRPNYGPPHASSTGVYMEGLIDSFEMARELGDELRTDKYRLAIVNGLRSLKQVMFKDDADMFYVRKRDFLKGGVRTTVYNNVVRVDNVQHNQMAILKILRAFEDADFSAQAKVG